MLSHFFNFVYNNKNSKILTKTNTAPHRICTFLFWSLIGLLRFKWQTINLILIEKSWRACCWRLSTTMYEWIFCCPGQRQKLNKVVIYYVPKHILFKNKLPGETYSYRTIHSHIFQFPFKFKLLSSRTELISTKFILELPWIVCFIHQIIRVHRILWRE